jgi:membrane dipeptidase
MDTRRAFLKSAGAVLAGGAAAPSASSFAAGPSGNPYDYPIVEGHRDIWELTDRFKLRDKSQHSPMRDFLVPRLIEGGITVSIIPAGGDSEPQRDMQQPMFEGSMRVLDMLLVEIEKTNGKASIIKTKADVPKGPTKGKVQIFLDLEGGGPIEIQPEPEYHPDRRLALLRQFFRLGVRGMQLTHHARNGLADGWWEGKKSGGLSKFGVEVVKEMNRLGMMIGVSHLSGTGVLQTAELSKHPIVSTHQNVHPFVNTDLELTDEEIKAIAKTGGIVGIRHLGKETPYPMLADEIMYLVKQIGVEHVGLGWMGHDKGHPEVGYIPGVSSGKQFTGLEAQSIYEHFSSFIKLLIERGLSEKDINLVLGGNYLRIWNQILPAA